MIVFAYFTVFSFDAPGLTRVAVKMLKPHHSGSEHAEADLLSEYNLLKEVRIVMISKYHLLFLGSQMGLDPESSAGIRCNRHQIC